MGPYRVMRSDLIIMTMCEPPMASLEKVQQMDALIRDINSQAKVVHTIFRPKPLENVKGSKVLFAVTTLPSMVNALSKSLEDEHGCEVIMASTHLANRQKLIKDITYALDEHPEIDTLITEVKAAGIDVATRMAIGSGLRVVYIDNILRTVGGDGDLPQLIKEIAQLAVKRYAERR
jgi:cyclic 2,3-diphosphoglycerate synthetase